MKITKIQLKQIIKEEIENVMEGHPGAEAIKVSIATHRAENPPGPSEMEYEELRLRFQDLQNKEDKTPDEHRELENIRADLWEMGEELGLEPVEISSL